jgi:alkaline phosphatase D
MVTVSRRGVMAGLAAGAALAPLPVRAQGVRFTHNVASGDPLPTRVMLWTRCVPDQPGAVRVAWEVAADERFETLVASGVATTGPERDYTVKVDAGGLAPGRWYAYRFRMGETISPVGRTRTLPVGDVSQLRLAVFSCSNLPFGYFHAYAHAAARDDIDLALHLGDYIYEYENGKYPSKTEAMAERALQPNGETITLADYRARYATYRTDPDLQALHQRLPMIVVWDDHESANDTYNGGAQEHDSTTEGPWPVRLAAATQAYFEWMPIRGRWDRPQYRAFEIGNLASLLMLDTRVVGRDKQLDYNVDLGLPAGETRPEVLAELYQRFARDKWDVPSRTLLGRAQERWLAARLRASRSRGATWQIIGQQIQTGMVQAAPAVLDLLKPDLNRFSRSWVNNAVQAGRYGLPLNQDAWAGYPQARRRLLGDIERTGANAVFLAGDTHNHYAFALMGEAPDGRPSAVEFGAGSVTSPGFESAFADPAAGARAMVAHNPELKWANFGQRGYVTATFTPDQAEAIWLGVDSIRTKSFVVAPLQSAMVKPVVGAGLSPMRLIMS